MDERGRRPILVPVALAVDADGNAYLAGTTGSPTFPIAPAGNALQSSLRGVNDAFVTKVGPTGTTIVYSTYLGGAGSERLTGLALDAKRNVHVTGTTTSADFPTRNALQPERRGANDGFVARINADGTALIHATYLGGATTGAGDFAEIPEGVGVDDRGDTYVVGRTGSSDFPLANPLQDANPTAPSESGFITEITTPALVVTPASAEVAAGASRAFVASAGSGPGYRFSLKVNASGGAVDPTTGAYTAGPKADVVDEVLVVDEAGDEAVATVTVTAGLATDAGGPPPNAPVPPGQGDPTTGPDAGAPEMTESDACSCRVPGRSTSKGGVSEILAVAAAALVVRRRRRGRASAL